MTTKSTGAIDQEIAKRVFAHRTQRGLSQSEVGEKLGVTFQQVQKYETATNRIGAGRLFQMAAVFNIPVEALFPKTSSVAASSAAASQPELVSDLLFTADGRRLCSAFAKIADPKVRKKVIALVEALIEPDEQQA